MSEVNKAAQIEYLQTLCRDQATRIEELEFEVEHERYNVEKTAQEAAKRIKALEAALRQCRCQPTRAILEPWPKEDI
jgi:chromosome segregation ATPase